MPTQNVSDTSNLSFFQGTSSGSSQIKFLPSYVGSKAKWVKYLQPLLQGKKIYEPFCGSSMISASLAAEAHLNDSDPMVHKILSNYQDLKEHQTFSRDDYYNVRKEVDWWRYSYYLQKLSFSGIFRYSKNGFNASAKPIKQISILPALMKAKNRMRLLNPVITNLNYLDIPISKFSGWAIILDPPYEGSQAAYNGAFNYSTYWAYVDVARKTAEFLVVFDRLSNLNRAFPKFGDYISTRKMRVNGRRKGDVEGMLVFHHGEPIQL